MEANISPWVVLYKRTLGRKYKHTSVVSTDVEAASHEIGEWMNDPLLTNNTPSWGHIGEVSNCSSKLEVGDPANKKSMPVITLSGYGYHVQELAFIGWFFDFSIEQGESTPATVRSRNLRHDDSTFAGIGDDGYFAVRLEGAVVRSVQGLRDPAVN